MDAITRALAREDLLNIVRQAGATDAAGGDIAAGAICFAPHEFEGFIERLFAHQKAILMAYIAERRQACLGGEVPLDDLLGHLAERLGIEQ